MNKEDRLVLISGGSGYVGSKLVERLVGRGWRVRVMETNLFGNPIEKLAGENCEFVTGDITEYGDCNRAMVYVTDVIHLAGIVTDKLVDMNREKGRAVNVQGTLNLLNCAGDWGIAGRFIYASSSSIYGTAGPLPNEDTEPEPQTAYAQQKLEAERFVLLEEGFITTAVRQATACGPAPRMRLDTVVNIFSYQAYFNRKVTPYGGKQYRSNVHVADAAAFYEHLLDAPADVINGKPWNLTNHNLKVAEIATLVAVKVEDMLGEPVEIEFVDAPDSRSYTMDGTRTIRKLSFYPERGVAEAVADNVKWFRETNLDPTDDIYFNDRRMREFMLQENTA